MSKLAAIIFSCERDKELMKLTSDSLRVKGVPVAVAFDKDDDCPAPGDTTRMKTDFPRGHSLNQSPECVCGILEAMNEIDADTILKVDSDTLLTGGLDHIDFSAYDLVGQRGTIVARSQGKLVHTYPYAHGHAYAISRELLDSILSHKPTELLKAVDAYSRGLLSKSPGPVIWPEDETISLMAQMLSPDANKWLLTDQALPFVADFDHATQASSPGVFTNFGNSSNREQILKAMIEATNY
jgi:hypothetical protein